jgi:hypothetical protein
MNIYNFIFCFFCKKYGNSGPGRIYGSGMLLFTVFFQFFFLSEILTLFTGFKLISFISNLPKSNFYFYASLITFGLVLYFDSKRVERLMEQYYSRDEYVQQGDTNRIILYVLGSFFAALLVMAFRQKYFGI